MVNIGGHAQQGADNDHVEHLDTAKFFGDQVGGHIDDLNVVTRRSGHR
jgi:hypothetical protein